MTLLLYLLAVLFIISGLLLAIRILRIITNSEECTGIITHVQVETKKYKHHGGNSISDDRRSYSKRITYTPTLKYTDVNGQPQEGKPLFYTSLIWKPEVGETVAVRYSRTSPEKFILKKNNRTTLVLFISGIFLIAGISIAIAVTTGKIG